MIDYSELTRRKDKAKSERVALAASLPSLKLRAEHERALLLVEHKPNPFAGADQAHREAVERVAALDAQLADFELAERFASYATAAAVVLPMDQRIAELGDQRRTIAFNDREQREAVEGQLARLCAARLVQGHIHDSLRTLFFGEVPIETTPYVDVPPDEKASVMRRPHRLLEREGCMFVLPDAEPQAMAGKR